MVPTLDIKQIKRHKQKEHEKISQTCLDHDLKHYYIDVVYIII